MASRGDARRGRGGKLMGREEELSRKFSRLLRHQAEREGLQLSEGGYIPVMDVLANRTVKLLAPTWPEILDLVANNPKQRFGLAAAPHNLAAPIPPTRDSDPADYLIRANQGHSIQIESSALLTRIDATNIPAMCIHGTNHASWRLILKSGGLKKMSRTHVHFSRGLPKGFMELVEEIGASAEERQDKQGSRADVVVPTAATRNSIGDKRPSEPPEVVEPVAVPIPETEAIGVSASSGQRETDEVISEAPDVISGMRATSSILIYLDLRGILEAGIPFWVSENGVLLSEGDQAGLVPLEYFSKVEDRRTRKIIVRNGQVVGEAADPTAAEVGRLGSGGRGGQRNSRGRGERR